VGAATLSATRRQLIARGIAGARKDRDVGALRALVYAEQVLVATYEQVVAAAVLSPPATSRATQFLGHEHAHLRAVGDELQRLGGVAPPPPPTLSVAAAPGSDPDALRLLLALERAALTAYYAELARLRDPQAARVAAEIMACGAQHTTELRELLSPGDVMRAVPGPFVFGTP
jgi:hypothetical protein